MEEAVRTVGVVVVVVVPVVPVGVVVLATEKEKLLLSKL